MRIIFPVQYEIFGKTQSTKGNVSRCFEELVALDVPEVDVELAPVAVRWVPTADTVHDPATIDRCISGPDGVQQTRWFENAHWQRLCEGHFDGKMRNGNLVTTQSFQGLLLGSSYNLKLLKELGISPFPPFVRRRQIARVDADPSGDFESIKWSGRNEHMTSLEVAANGLISVGGVIHRKCIEPFASVSVHFTGGSLRCQDIGIEASVAALWDAKRTNVNISLKDWVKAEEFALEQGLEGFDFATDRPEILLPESLSDEWNLAYRVGLAITSLKKSLWMCSTTPMGLLDEAIRCNDVNRQFEIMSEFHFDKETWSTTHAVRSNYAEVMDLLDSRPISIGLASHDSYTLRTP